MLAVGLVAPLLFGCAVCDNPYDYCGPTFTDGQSDTCYTDERVASIFTEGMPQYGATSPIEPRKFDRGEEPQEFLPTPADGPPESVNELPTPPLPEPEPEPDDTSSSQWKGRVRS